MGLLRKFKVKTNITLGYNLPKGSGSKGEHKGRLH